jgi:hypothetical protein
MNTDKDAEYTSKMLDIQFGPFDKLCQQELMFLSTGFRHSRRFCKGNFQSKTQFFKLSSLNEKLCIVNWVPTTQKF